MQGFQQNYYFSNNDPTIAYDAHELFLFYNSYFFKNILQKCTLSWSSRMTLCAGTCQYMGCGSCLIKLSEPLLKFRTTNELKQTILHEMIHAYLFITNMKACMKEGGHGEEFKSIMRQINAVTRLNVTVYHTFHDQVQSYRIHVWRCNGKCQTLPPFYGYCKRSMNRKPQKADKWWNQHQSKCGGTFIKISGGDQLNKDKNSLNKQKKCSKQNKGGQTHKRNTKKPKLKPNNHSSKVQAQKGKTIYQYIKQIQLRKSKKQQGVRIGGEGRQLLIDAMENYNSQESIFRTGSIDFCFDEQNCSNAQKVQQMQLHTKQQDGQVQKYFTFQSSNNGKTIQQIFDSIQRQNKMSQH